tara:strand:+ start:58 stop:729 length:672 start_codon:yes stop_codon:yes gene_type:complete
MKIIERRLRSIIREVLEDFQSDENEVNNIARNIISKNPQMNLNNIDVYLNKENLYMTDFGDYQGKKELLRNAILEILSNREYKKSESTSKPETLYNILHVVFNNWDKVYHYYKDTEVETHLKKLDNYMNDLCEEYFAFGTRDPLGELDAFKYNRRVAVGAMYRYLIEDSAALEDISEIIDDIAIEVGIPKSDYDAVYDHILDITKAPDLRSADHFVKRLKKYR